MRKDTSLVQAAEPRLRVTWCEIRRFAVLDKLTCIRRARLTSHLRTTL